MHALNTKEPLQDANLNGYTVPRLGEAAASFG
jgi:hypothetical protein